MTQIEACLAIQTRSSTARCLSVISRSPTSARNCDTSGPGTSSSTASRRRAKLLEHAGAISRGGCRTGRREAALQSQIKSYEARREPVDPRAQHFVEWYTKEYGEAPPQELIDRRRRRSWSLAWSMGEAPEKSDVATAPSGPVSPTWRSLWRLPPGPIATADAGRSY